MRGAVLVLLLLLGAASPLNAQDGRQLFNFFLNQVEGEIQREQLRRHEHQRRQFEQQQRAEHQRLYQQLLPHWHACFGGDLPACERALASPVLSFDDRQRLLAQRTSLIAAQEHERERQRRAEIARAEEERQRQVLEQLERVERERAAALEREKQSRIAEEALREQLRLVQNSQQPQRRGGSEASMLTAAATVPTAQRSIFILILFLLTICFAGTLLLAFRVALVAWLGRVTRRMALLFSIAEDAPETSPNREQSASSKSVQAETTVNAAADGSLPPRDPITAAQALRLAHAYLTEVDDDIAKDIDEPSALANHRSTLALAARQLDIAERADPGTALEIPSESGPPTLIPQAVLRAAIVTAEARTHALENTTKAIALLTQATALDPEHGPAYALLGHLYFNRCDKPHAVAAFERALALSPDDLSLIKALDRARNLTPAEAFAYRATRATTATIEAGAKTISMLKAFIAGLVLLLLVAFLCALITGKGTTAVAIWIALTLIGLGIKGIDSARAWVKTHVTSQ